MTAAALLKVAQDLGGACSLCVGPCPCLGLVVAQMERARGTSTGRFLGRASLTLHDATNFFLPASLLHRRGTSGTPALLRQGQPAHHVWGEDGS
eukprot:10493981-Alexandrium_andersonii.AAC.1